MLMRIVRPYIDGSDAIPHIFQGDTNEHARQGKRIDWRPRRIGRDRIAEGGSPRSGEALRCVRKGGTAIWKQRARWHGAHAKN
jgi:hypothetical protein